MGKPVTHICFLTPPTVFGAKKADLEPKIIQQFDKLGRRVVLPDELSRGRRNVHARGVLEALRGPGETPQKLVGGWLNKKRFYEASKNGNINLLPDV